ncbi:hypothetical protein OEZ86_012127 [Tetradesmus obliquus]|nr:hypothetical protein OEZ86_012127 [Tetradesmus obliquus]
MALKVPQKPHPSIPAPQSVEEARRYIGSVIWKRFEDNQLWEGKVLDIDTELHLDDGSIERRGPYFLIHYRADGQEEHMQWPEMSHLLVKAEKWTGGKKRKGGTEAAGASSDPASAAEQQQQQQPQQGGKRRRSAQQPARYAEAAADAADAAEDDEDADMAEAEDDDDDASADPEYRRVHTLAGAARAALDGKRGQRKRSGQQQQQQQRGSSGRKQQQQQRGRRARDENSDPDQDDAAAAAAAADEDDDEAAQLAGQEDADEEDDDDDGQEQYTDAQLEEMVAEDGGELVAVRAKGLAGHLKHVQVQNFMCHQNFAMDFGTHVNVVSGSNGSGKSAVLQAMQCALGAKAKQTGRGDKNGELVRTGCHEAKVQVTLWNTGEDAYQHQRYGDWLTVERVIKVNGSSKWRLLDHEGRKVSERRKDLDDLLDHLNIDATNPLAVMTQDTSRNFLCGAVADKKKYELFMQATMLEAMQANLSLAQGYVDAMKDAEKHIVADHSKRKARLDETREKLARLEETAGLVGRMQTFEKAQAWAAVDERLRLAELLRQHLEDELPQKLAQQQRYLDDTEQHLADKRQEEEQLTADATQYQASQENFTAEMTGLSDALKAARLQQRTATRAARAAEAKLQSLQEELKTLLESKQESSDDRQREYADALQQHQVQVAAAQQEAEAAQARLAQHEQQQQQALEAKRAKEEELRTAQQMLQSKQQTLHNLAQQQQQLRAAKGQKLALFGQHAQLRAQVDRSKRAFERLPIGPIGAHLTLTNEMWKVATEVVLGSNLETWIVHCRRDKETLFKMAEQLRMRRPTVVEASFDRPPYTIPPAKQVPQGWATLRQFVRVEHPHFAHIIDNKLMDMSHYERVVVDQEESRAKHAIYQRAAGPNVGRAVDVTGRSWTRSGVGVTVSNNILDRAPRVGASFEAHLTSLEQDLQKQQDAKNVLQQQVAALHAEVQQLGRHAEQLQQEGRRMLKQRMTTQNRCQMLQTQAPIMDADGDGDDGDDDLAEQQRALQEAVAQAQIARDRAAADLEQAHAKHEQAQALYDSRTGQMQEMLASLNTRNEAMQVLVQQKAGFQGAADAFRRHIQKLQAEEAATRANAEQVAQTINDLKQEALSVQGGTEEEGWAALAAAREEMHKFVEAEIRKRIAAGRSAPMSDEAIVEAAAAAYRDSVMQNEVQRFRKKADELHKRVAAAEQDAGGNRQELQDKLAKAEAEWRRHEPSVRNMRQIVRFTDRAVRERWAKFTELFDTVSSTVCGKFMAYMHRRGHQGKVRVDQATGELRLLVKVNAQGQGADARKSKAVRDLKQLSGGERSFTTVAFILALGEFTESPFRAMDEFDVFMDAINRRIATQTLLEFAREKRDLQFIFLTPQDLQAVEDAKRKLAEDRGGAPLPEGFVKCDLHTAAWSSSMIVCAAVVGQQNNPLFIRLFAPSDDEVKFHYMVHASLDAVEEKVLLRRNPGEVPELYLGLLYPTEEYRVYGYITNTHIKFVLVLDEVNPRDDALQKVFKRLHNLFVDVTSNPLYTHGLPITSRAFAEGVAAIVKSYTPA